MYRVYSHAISCSYRCQIALDLKSLQTDDKVLCWMDIWVYTKFCKRTIKYSADGSGIEEHAFQVDGLREKKDLTSVQCKDLGQTSYVSGQGFLV